jgi:toxin ParE1/3/4
MKVHLTKVATRQLRAILAHVAAENPVAAEEIVARMEEIQEFLGANPYAGYALPRNRLRRFPVRPFSYLIYYEVSEETFRIIRVRHAALFRKAVQEAASVFRR